MGTQDPNMPAEHWHRGDLCVLRSQAHTSDASNLILL